MSKLDVTDFYIYRWRYWIGYTLIGVALVATLVFAGLYVPGGLSTLETESVVKSDSLQYDSIDTIAVTHLAFHMLQQASIAVFGVTMLSIKLPSLLLGFLSAGGMIVLLRRWFRPGIAVLASVIAVTTGQFLFLAQQGSPQILYIFWPVALLLLATLVAKRSQLGILWKVLFFITAALSLYTPLSIYVLIALGSAVVLHPHLRYLLRRLSKKKILAAIGFASLLLIPLVWAIVLDPRLGLALLGVPEAWPNLLDNVQILTQQYFSFMSIGEGSLMTPVFGLGSMLIIGYGLYRLIRTRQTVQSYVILAWLGFLLPVLVINPSFTSITFLPLLLLLATGLSGIQNAWYKLFPRNPYARVAGLVPMIVLVASLVLFGLERYVYGYHYAPATVQHFSRDLRLLPADTDILVVHRDERAFYAVVAKYRSELTVTTETPGAGTFTTTRRARATADVPSTIITSPLASEANRFYVYTM